MHKKGRDNLCLFWCAAKLFLFASYTYTDDQNKYLASIDYGNEDSVKYTYDNYGRLETQTYGNEYTATIRYTIFDHFGLDDGDVTDSGWYSYFLGYTNEFGSWYVLQRYENCNEQHKPFVTYVVFDEVINGTLSN